MFSFNASITCKYCCCPALVIIMYHRPLVGQTFLFYLNITTNQFHYNTFVPQNKHRFQINIPFPNFSNELVISITSNSRMHISFLFANKYLTRPTSIRWSNNASHFHLIHNACSSRITDSKTTLQHRN